MVIGYESTHQDIDKVTSSSAGFTYRVATNTDNEAILAFMSSQPMKAGLQLRFDRSPDFFALPRLQGDEHETHLFEKEGEIVGLASLVIRDGYINGQIEKVVYLSDLRIQSSRKLAGRWHRLFIKRMNELAAERNINNAFTVILSDNHAARNALVNKPRFNVELVSSFHTISLLARKPWAKKPTKFTVKRANHSNVDEIAELLDSTNKEQAFGLPFSDGLLNQRFQQWPNFSIENFLLVFEENGELLGCLAPWDYSSVKNVVFDSLPFGANLLRQVLNFSAPLTGRPIINNPPNTKLPDVAITHLAIKDRRQDVFATLLDALVKQLFSQKRFATISLCLFENDPLRSALHNYWYYSVPMDLFSFRGDSSSDDQGQPARVIADGPVPGFEFYLA